MSGPFFLLCLLPAPVPNLFRYAGHSQCLTGRLDSTPGLRKACSSLFRALRYEVWLLPVFFIRHCRERFV